MHYLTENQRHGGKKTQRKAKIQTSDSSNQLVHLPNAGSQETIQVSQVSGKDPSTGAFISAFKGAHYQKVGMKN